MGPNTKSSSRTRVDSCLSAFAKGMPGLIGQWRAEISPQKRYRANIKPAKLEKFLSKAEVHGVPVGMVVLTVLCCEWTFRIRHSTEEDVERELSKMEYNLCKPPHPALTPFQAKLLVKLLEVGLRRELKNVQIPIIFGCASGDSGLGVALFTHGQSHTKRVPHKHVVSRKSGRIPLLGPIIAGVIAGALFEETRVGKNGWKIGRELCEILLNTRVPAPRFRAWRSTFGKAWGTLPTSRARCTERMKVAYYPLFEMPGEAMPPKAFLQACKTDPSRVIGWLAQEEVLEAVYSQKWADLKTR